MHKVPRHEGQRAAAEPERYADYAPADHVPSWDS